MILINLLPPELRKRSGGVSPMFASIVGGGGLCLLLAVFYAYIVLFRIPYAKTYMQQKTDELEQKTKLADEVEVLKKQIAEFRERRNKIVGLLAKKVYWARTMDEFALLLNGPWTIPGFDVRCQELNVVEGSAGPAGGGPERRGGAGSNVQYNVTWKYKLVGKERPLAGDYIQSFFNTIKNSPFWGEQGFQGKPEDSYRGDQPRMNNEISRVVIEGTLDWQRVKIIKDKSLAGN